METGNSFWPGADSLALRPGDRVVWAAQSGRDIPGILRKIGPKRCQISIPISGWMLEHKWVPKVLVKPRILPCAALKEPMMASTKGFALSGRMDPIGTTDRFPDGIWRGEIDGYPIGPRVRSEEAAIRSAFSSLANGGYREALLSVKDHHESHLQQHELEPTTRDETIAALPDLMERLAKIEKILLADQDKPQEVLLYRGNPARGPATGEGYGRKVAALFLREFDQTGHNVKCKLLEDDPGAVGKPNFTGEEGWWCVNSIIWRCRDVV